MHVGKVPVGLRASGTCPSVSTSISKQSGPVSSPKKPPVGSLPACSQACGLASSGKGGSGPRAHLRGHPLLHPHPTWLVGAVATYRRARGGTVDSPCAQVQVQLTQPPLLLPRALRGVSGSAWRSSIETGVQTQGQCGWRLSSDHGWVARCVPPVPLWRPRSPRGRRHPHLPVLGVPCPQKPGCAAAGGGGACSV